MGYEPDETNESRPSQERATNAEDCGFARRLLEDGASGNARSGAAATAFVGRAVVCCGGAPQRRVGGLSRATQPVFGALGAARKEANTCCAQRDLATVSCPTPGMATTVELGSVRAAIRA